MAVTKIWAIKDSLQRVLDYAANPDKTEYDALAQTLHYAENDAKTKLNESAQLVTFGKWQTILTALEIGRVQPPNCFPQPILRAFCPTS